MPINNEGKNSVNDEDLENLEAGLRRLKVEYHIFFSGNRKNPPDDLRIRVERIVKKLSESADMNASQRFRFSTLVTRYYVYKDLWRREVQKREMDLSGRDKPVSRASAPIPSSRPTSEAIRISISDPKTEEEKVRQLYDALIHLKKNKSQETPLSYSQFSKYIATQTLSLRKKYGCARVSFTIALDEDVLRFTAATDDL
jgi:hypothetical protein